MRRVYTKRLKVESSVYIIGAFYPSLFYNLFCLTQPRSFYSVGQRETDLRGINTLSREIIVKISLLPSEKRSTLKGKNLFSYFLLELTPFQNGIGVQESAQKVIKDFVGWLVNSLDLQARCHGFEYRSGRENLQTISTLSAYLTFRVEYRKALVWQTATPTAHGWSMKTRL